MRKYGENRCVLVEKIKPWDYVDSWGNRVWLDRYGEIVKKQSYVYYVLCGIDVAEKLNDVSEQSNGLL